MRENLKKGFTLIELMVSVLIVMIIASLIIVNLNEARKKSRDAKRKTDLSAMAAALQAYYADYHTYPATNPASCSGWVGEPGTNYAACITGGSSYSGASGYVPNIAPSYINILPGDPRQRGCIGNPNERGGYLYKSNGVRYKLLAYCTPEGSFDTSDPFYDPLRTPPNYGTWQISSDGTALTTF